MITYSCSMCAVALFWPVQSFKQRTTSLALMMCQSCNSYTAVCYCVRVVSSLWIQQSLLFYHMIVVVVDLKLHCKHCSYENNGLNTATQLV